MTYQAVRGFWEKLSYDALRTAGVDADQISFDNYGETAAPADKAYAVITLTFAQTIQDVLACEGIEDLRGTLQCNVYTPKQAGSKTGEDIALEVIKAWSGVNKRGAVVTPLLRATTRNIEGPTTIAPDQRPHHVNVVSCAIKARVA